MPNLASPLLLVSVALLTFAGGDAVLAAAEPAARLPVHEPGTGATVIQRWDGATIRIGGTGLGSVTEASGRRSVPVAALPSPKNAAGLEQGVVNDLALVRRMALPQRGAYSRHEVVMVMASASVTGAPVAKAGTARVHAARTSDAGINATLVAVGARSLRPLAPLAGSGIASLSASGLDLSRAVVVDLQGLDARAAAQRLAATPGVQYAAPNWTVASMSSDPVRIPAAVLQHAPRPAPVGDAAVRSPVLPDNYAVTTSESSFLNASGVNAIAAYATIGAKYHQLPGAGVVVTNVCLGDLTDQQMADNGDPYVQLYGPTTTVISGQRYLDYPSLPLIPTWVAHPDGSLDPLGTVEQVDPFLGEVLLDFSVMAPLPHAQQRPEALGSGYSDLLGIAPGASYRLVVPDQPTIADILTAALAAAQQQPRPDVMNFSLGFGFDSAGFPGRFLEDDPLSRAVIQSIVDQGIVVTVSANDGLRAYTNAAIGPDGGSAPTQRPLPGQAATTVSDVAFSTTPSVTPDSGSLAVGGTTLDDIFSAPPQNRTSLSRQLAFPTTRLNGGQGYSSGFGSRIDVSAPGDNIPALLHVCQSSPCSPQDALVVLDGGTSASAPMTAAAAAVVLQVARLSGQHLTPLEVRQILARTGRSVPQAPQTASLLNVGTQIDVGAAVNAVLARHPGTAAAHPTAVRLAVAHRQWADVNLGTDFIEATDPTSIDLQGPYDAWVTTQAYGQNVAGPVTLSADIVGDVGGSQYGYVWTIGSHELHTATPSIRLLPAEILAMAQAPLASPDPRSVPVTFAITHGEHAVSTLATTLTFGPTDATYTWPLAPVVAPVAVLGSDVPLSFDLSHLRSVSNPLLVVSSIDHWNALTAPKFRQGWTMPLSGLQGQVSIPAAAFGAGAGIYGISIVADDSTGDYGQFAAVRITNTPGPLADAALAGVRPPAPTLTPGSGISGHSIILTNASPGFAVHYDVSGIPGADGAFLEVSAPGPTIYGLYSTFTNQNGSQRDVNGIDTGSSAWQPLPGRSGSVSLDAKALGLHPSLQYSVRIFAAQGGHPLGQASPVASIEFDDGPLPAGAVTSFAINPSGVSFASLNAAAGPVLNSSSIVPYDRSRGSYGAPLAADASGTYDFSVLGVDAGAGLLATIRDNNLDYSQQVTTYNIANGSVASSAAFTPTAGSWNIVGAGLDDARHRMALLAWDPSTYADNVFSYDLGSGALGKPIGADVGTSFVEFFNSITVDRATGIAFPYRILLSDICVVLPGGISRVDLDRSLASPIAKTNGCVTSAAPDNKGGRLFVTLGPLFSYPALLPPARLQHFNETTLAHGAITNLGASSPLFSTIDPVNHLYVTGFIASDNYLADNNAMSAVGIFREGTGERIAYLPWFNFIPFALGSAAYNWLYTQDGIQLDPKTRTGWTFGPAQSQIQRFQY